MLKLFTTITVVVVVATGVQLVDRHPPHVARPAAAVTTWPLETVGIHPGDLVATIEYVRGHLEPEPVHLESAATPEPAAPPSTPHPAAPPADLPDTGCDGHVIPGWILMRESRCSYDAWNPGGCGGHGCVGLYQFDLRHFTGWANGQAACGDLDPWTPADQDECAARLSHNGTNLAPWGA